MPLLATTVLAFTGFRSVKSLYSEDENIMLIKQNIEALTKGSEDEYSIGPAFTNWKEYHIQCQQTTGIDIFGFVSTTTTTYWADVCGKGSGSCWEIAGC